MDLPTQADIEQRMFTGGIERAEGMMLRAEESGRANQNPYGKAIMRDFIFPLADKIKEDCAPHGRPGPRAAHVTLLRALDAEAVAFLAVRATLNMCMQHATKDHTTNGGNPGANHRAVANRIGHAVHAELVLSQIEQFNPDLYYTLANELDRRKSKDEKHRIAMMRVQARDAGILWDEWPTGARDQVGMYLMGLLEQAGMVSIHWPAQSRGRKQLPGIVMISDTVFDRIMQIKGFVAITQPIYGPCVEPPRDWTAWNNGGFHTGTMQRALRRLVKAHPSARPWVFSEPAPIVWDAANMLQRTAWQVNTDVYDVVMQLAKAGVGTKEIATQHAVPKPERPAWLDESISKELMSPEQADEFKKWKHTVAEWHTQRKLAGIRDARFYAATRMAYEFKDHPALHFVYFADSRGRFYPLTYGINPQGSDLQKALLRFAVGKPLDSAESIRWFHILGANKFGFDKATLSQRFMWAHERREWILHIVSDPLNHREWLDAGDPLQFLAWCFEYADWVADPDAFRSHLPVNMDGSCNGLQNLSAMLRDEVGGHATNLTDNETMEDIYRLVAEAAVVRMSAAECADPRLEAVRRKWLAHGVSRSVVKRSVMTTPYGVTKRSATDYVISDYLAKEPTPFAREEWRDAAKVLMEHAWPAIGDIVVKGRQAMDWLKKGARKIVKEFPADADPVITWRTPSGFPASQAYYEVNEHRINTRLAGTETIKIVVHSEAEDPDPTRHSSGLAPNFVHSLDASHLHRVAARCLHEGVASLMAVHDDYGTHAADAQQLFDLIRQEFVAMYTTRDPVGELFNRFPMLGEPPSMGSLDIQEVLRSDFFFS
jgi:DNA-directed RNA polymerase